MKIKKFDNINESNNQNLDDYTIKLSHTIHSQVTILNMAVNNISKIPLEKIDIDKIIEKMKELKERLVYAKDAKKYNL